MNRKTPDWTLWRSFGAVVEHGSLSAAARQLKLSQPTLGRHIETLETSLGTSLFTRSIKGFEPNAAATRLFEQVQKAQIALTEAEILAEGTSTKLSGTVRITASTVTSHYTLPRMLAHIRQKFPAIDIELVPSDSPKNLLMRESDIAVRMFRPTQLELITRKVGESPLVCCAHQDFLKHHPIPEKFEDLTQSILVGFDQSELATDIAKSMGYDLQRSHFALRTDSQTAMWEMVKAGLGIGFAQNNLVEETPGMQILLPDLRLPPMEIWLTTHKELFTSARIRVIYDLLGDLLRQQFA